MADTIAAIATAPGQGGVSIVRISGDEAERVLMEVFRPAKRSIGALSSHLLTYGHAVNDDGERLDECMAVLMRAPRSYTREDVAELHLHGGAYTAQAVLRLCLRHGARLAQPGEFTRRAFLNGRIDLSQAEAVMGLIAAQGERAHASAMRQLDGGASAIIREAADTLYQLQAGAAACIDYPEEVSEEEACEELEPRLLALAEHLEQACDARASHLVTDGLQVVLAGRPNAGKSSLFNALLGEQRAIVTDIPGTTRDVVQGEMVLNGTVIRLYDTAGLHETDDPVERLGMQRTGRAMAEADCVLLVVDGHKALSEDERAQLRALRGRTAMVLVNKNDLEQAVDTEEIIRLAPQTRVLSVCAGRPESLAPLLGALAELARVDDRIALTQPRHLDAAQRAVTHLRAAARSLREGTVDLAAIDMQSAQSALAEITGDQVDERLLDAVFSSFCVGK